MAKFHLDSVEHETSFMQTPWQSLVPAHSALWQATSRITTPEPLARLRSEVQLTRDAGTTPSRDARWLASVSLQTESTFQRTYILTDESRQHHQDNGDEYAYGWNQDDGNQQPSRLGLDHAIQPPSPNYDQPNPPGHVHNQYPDEYYWDNRYDPGGHRVNYDRKPPQHGNEAPSDHFYHPDHTGHRDDSAKAPDLEQQRPLDTPQMAEIGADSATRDSGWQPDSSAVHHHHYHVLPKKKKKESSGSAQAK